MVEEAKNKRRSIIGTILFYVVVSILLYFFGFRSRIPSSEEGVLISFGNTEMGSGTTQPKPVAQNNTPSTSEAVKPTPPEPSTAEESGKEDIKTQEFDDEAPKIEAGKPKPKVDQPDPEEEKRKAEEAERLKKEQEEALRIQQEQERKAAEEAARKQKILDQLAELDKEQANNNSNTSSSSDNPFSGKGTETSEGQGNTNFPGNSGSQSGDANSNADKGKGLGKSGNSFDLTGRQLSGSLPSPNYSVQEEGTVVIEIVVDRNGKVIGATAKLRGSTTQNPELLKVAKEAALKARFNSSANAPAKQTGTITYHFQLD